MRTGFIISSTILCIIFVLFQCTVTGGESYRLYQFDSYQGDAFTVYTGDQVIVDVAIVSPDDGDSITVYFQQYGGVSIYHLVENVTNVSYDFTVSSTENWLLIVENDTNGTIDVVIQQKVVKNDDTYRENFCIILPTVIFPGISLILMGIRRK